MDAVRIKDKTKCSGCYACYNSCPKDCIAMVRDSEGFVYPQIDADRCIECGLCKKACPMVHQIISKEHYPLPKIYAAWSLEDTVRLNSTSGGIFSEIALSRLKTGAFVVGAQYGKGQHIEHTVIHSEEGLAKIRQSKYAQSDIGYIYREIKGLLKQGEEVVFCGTPCECAGLHNYLGGCYQNLYLIDFVCRGANSPKVYERFIEYLEKKYRSKIRKIWFKNKTFGWNRFSTKVEFDNGRHYLKDRYHDMYITGYIIHNLFIRPSCNSCKFKGFPRVSDITLADFWGIRLKDASKDTDKGTSLVFINSDKGEELFGAIRDSIFCEEKTLEEAMAGNASIGQSVRNNPNREYFFDHLDDMPFDKLTRKCYKTPFKLKQFIKKTKRDVIMIFGKQKYDI